MAVPDSFRVDHDCRAVLALVQAPGLVDADPAAEAGGFGKLLQLRNQVALAIRCAGWAGSAFRTDVLADKYMAFKGCQTGISSSNHGTGSQSAGIPRVRNAAAAMHMAMSAQACTGETASI
jgi:hypothetical protein